MVVLGIVFIFIDLITPTNIINLFYVGILGVILLLFGLIFYIIEKFL
jgi:membrane-bound ClpP family serine protease